jgi:hypothetical protein
MHFSVTIRRVPIALTLVFSAEESLAQCRCFLRFDKWNKRWRLRAWQLKAAEMWWKYISHHFDSMLHRHEGQLDFMKSRTTQFM